MNEGQIFGVGIIFGVIVMGLLMTFLGEPSGREVHNAKAACEQSLARNKHCVLNFIPENP